jgi:hypothetical protein
MLSNKKAAWWRPELKAEDPNESSSSEDLKFGLGLLFALGFPVIVVLSVLALLLAALL